MFTWVRNRSKLIPILILVFALSLSGCKSINKDPRPQNIDPALTNLNPDQPIGVGLAPNVRVGLVLAQVINPVEGTTLVTGSDGAADVKKGVTEVCVINLSRFSSTSCANVNPQTGAFKAVLNGARVGDTLSVYTNGPGFLPGGVGKNDEKVYVTQFPLRIQNVKSLAFTTNHDLLIGTANGLQIVLNQSAHSTYYGILAGLPNDFIYSVISDGEGGGWVGTDGGLSRVKFIDGRAQFTNLTKADGLPSNSIRALALDGSGGVWIGTQDAAVSHLTFSNGKPVFQNITIFDGNILVQTVSAIAPDATGGFWLGTGRGIFHLSIVAGVVQVTNPVSMYLLPGYDVRSILVDRDGALWLGTWGGGSWPRFFYQWRTGSSTIYILHPWSSDQLCSGSLFRW